MSTLAQQISTLLNQEDSAAIQVEKLHGDASYRLYFRVTLEGGRTYIVMQMPTGKASASEEITNFSGTLERPAFLEMSDYLHRIKMRTPDVIAYDPRHRLIVLEDLGSVQLADKIIAAPSSDHARWYKKAIDFLIELQAKTLNNDNSLAFQRTFDTTLLNWEFDHFREYLIEARKNSPLPKEDRQLFEMLTRDITEEIQKIPRGFTHRDFQSRNIMVLPDDSLALIDFQDALTGPLLYDLVALLRDSYSELDIPTLTLFINYYVNEAKLANILSADTSIPTALNWFHLITLQRKMKDAGRFVYIEKVKGNPNYLSFIPRSLKYVKAALNELPKHKKLESFMERYVPEFKTL